MSDGAQIQEQAAWEHLQHVYLQHLKQIKVIKEKIGGDKVDLTIKNVIFRNSTLVTYTYI